MSGCCTYCSGKGGYPVMDFVKAGFQVSIMIERDLLIAHMSSFEDGTACETIEQRIRFCPVCGHDLIANVMEVEE